ncbi:SRPBCC family protein [Dyadobacter sp. NIV53]|uniref:SRPBCC family protein n=1 Tax=Dyadobacter sp. NIV53 TaxID=2861765 RepID=UPI001C88A8A1|nr:SRPBCC family protein [Dyadobacter sp. NIV53]
MNDKLIAETSVSIDAPVSEVWKAITTPSIIKKYLMGTNVTTDWKEGSPITYEGEYNGKKYKDKGIIRKIEPEKILESTYWSSAGGKEDKPENYNIVTYQLSGHDDITAVKLSQTNVRSEQEKEQATDNWASVLKKLKEVVEKAHSKNSASAE